MDFKILKVSLKSAFIKGVLTLMSGTVIAQVIPTIISPILTRLYSPSDFGAFSLYMSIASVLVIIATGRYEMAILLPKNDSDALNLTKLVIILSFVFSLVLIFVILISGQYIIPMQSNLGIQNWLLMIPVTIFLLGCYQGLNYYVNREKKFKLMALSRVLQSSTLSVGQMLLGITSFGPGGLILGNIIGIISSVFILIKKTKIEFSLHLGKIFDMGKRYVDFPKYLVFGHALNSLSAHLPIYLITLYFTSENVGQYSLTSKVLAIPLVFVSTSIGDVFKQRAAEDINSIGNCIEIFNKSLKTLVALSIIPFMTLFLISKWLFPFIFGAEWQQAGLFAQYLTLMFFFRFISSPLSSMYMIAEKQKQDLILQVILLFAAVSAFVLGKYIYNDIYISLAFYSIIYSVIYFVNLFITYGFAKGKNTKTRY